MRIIRMCPKAVPSVPQPPSTRVSEGLCLSFYCILKSLKGLLHSVALQLNLRFLDTLLSSALRKMFLCVKMYAYVLPCCPQWNISSTLRGLCKIQLSISNTQLWKCAYVSSSSLYLKLLNYMHQHEEEMNNLKAWKKVGQPSHVTSMAASRK